MPDTNGPYDNGDEAPKILASKALGTSSEAKKKKQTQLIVLGVLLLFFFYMIYSTFFSKPAVHKAAPMSANTESAAAGTSGKDDLDKLLDESVFQEKQAMGEGSSSDEDYWGKSPFSIDAEQQEEAVVKQHFHLQGTVLGPRGDEYAVLNEKIVKRGDRIADNTVKEIRHNSVILETDGGETIVVNGE